MKDVSCLRPSSGPSFPESQSPTRWGSTLEQAYMRSLPREINPMVPHQENPGLQRYFQIGKTQKNRFLDSQHTLGVTFAGNLQMVFLTLRILTRDRPRPRAAEHEESFQPIKFLLPASHFKRQPTFGDASIIQKLFSPSSSRLLSLEGNNAWPREKRKRKGGRLASERMGGSSPVWTVVA